MERAEKSTQSAHSRTAAEPSRSTAASIADHRPAAAAQRALAGWVAQREPIQKAQPDLDEPAGEEAEMLGEILNDPDLSADEREMFSALFQPEADLKLKMKAKAGLEMFRQFSWPKIKAEREAKKLEK